MPKVSVVLPTYNGEKYIAESIESVLAQSYTDFELIIVDDGSTDQTNKIINEYARKDSRVKVIVNEKNSKIPTSLNNGFKLAQGVYYTWTSDDNLYKKDALKVMVELLDEHSDVGLVYCDYEAIDENGQFVKEKKMEEPDKLYHLDCVGACFMYRASVAKEVGGYNPDMFLVEDYDYWLRVSFCTKLLHSCQNLYQYRVHGGSLSATRVMQVHNQNARLWMSHLEELLKNPMTYQEMTEFFEFIIFSAEDSERDGVEKELCRHSFPFCVRRIRKKIMRTIKRFLKQKGKEA